MDPPEDGSRPMPSLHFLFRSDHLILSRRAAESPVCDDMHPRSGALIWRTNKPAAARASPPHAPMSMNHAMSIGRATAAPSAPMCYPLRRQAREGLLYLALSAPAPEDCDLLQHEHAVVAEGEGRSDRPGRSKTESEGNVARAVSPTGHNPVTCCRFVTI